MASAILDNKKIILSLFKYLLAVLDIACMSSLSYWSHKREHIKKIDIYLPSFLSVKKKKNVKKSYFPFIQSMKQ